VSSSLRTSVAIIVLTLLGAMLGGWVGVRYGLREARASTQLDQLLHTRLHLSSAQEQQRLATAVNGSVPAPILRFREGDTLTINVTNRLAEPTSVHWHGLLLPNGMDGVPGLTFRGIDPGETGHSRLVLTAAPPANEGILALAYTLPPSCSRCCCGDARLGRLVGRHGCGGRRARIR
jgi:FtsP/CotA-like multicopper oxidase with cupredoxin domain